MLPRAHMVSGNGRKIDIQITISAFITHMLDYWVSKCSWRMRRRGYVCTRDLEIPKGNVIGAEPRRRGRAGTSSHSRRGRRKPSQRPGRGERGWGRPRPGREGLGRWDDPGLWGGVRASGLKPRLRQRVSPGEKLYPQLRRSRHALLRQFWKYLLRQDWQTQKDRAKPHTLKSTLGNVTTWLVKFGRPPSYNDERSNFTILDPNQKKKKSGLFKLKQNQIEVRL